MFGVRVTLSEKLARAHVYPPIDVCNSGAKREEMYMSQKALDALISLRKNTYAQDNDLKLYTLLKRCGADDELYTTLIEEAN
jgi:transcription termination factor Rho